VERELLEDCQYAISMEYVISVEK